MRLQSERYGVVAFRVAFSGMVDAPSRGEYDLVMYDELRARLDAVSSRLDAVKKARIAADTFETEEEKVLVVEQKTITHEILNLQEPVDPPDDWESQPREREETDRAYLMEDAPDTE